MASFLDKTGLTEVLTKLKAWVTSTVNAAKTAVGNYTVNGKKISSNPTISASDVGAIPTSQKGAASGVATLDANKKLTASQLPSTVVTTGSDGKVPTSMLPSFVDDVLEMAGMAAIARPAASSSTADDALEVWFSTSIGAFLAKVGNYYYTGWAEKNGYGYYTQYGTIEGTLVKPSAGKIYVDRSTNKTYRWSGSSMVEISQSLALGTTSSTAFRGDYGNTAYQHATKKGAAFASGLYKITTNSEGHVTAATAVTKTDITNLGIPSSDTKYTLPQATSTALGGVKIGFPESGKNYPVELNSSGQMFVNVPWANTTYSTATTSASGLMSATDKTRLDNLYHDQQSLMDMGVLEAGGKGFVQSIDSATASSTGIVIKATAMHLSSTGEAEAGYQNINLAGATQSVAGLLTAADKQKLDGIASGANKYTLPAATASTLGGVKLGSATGQITGANAVTSTAGRTYAVQQNSSGQLVVNVPWTSDTAITSTEIDTVFSNLGMA